MLPPEKSRRFLAVLGFAFAVEGALYSTVTPIIPLLSRRLGMSDWQAGVLLSSYGAGIVVGALLCVLLLRRTDARTAAAGALMLMATFSAVFAWASNYELALTSRFLQGISGGLIHTACVTWLLRLWSIEKRGEALGLAMGPAVFGTVAGPAVGTVAISLGIGGPYTVVAALCFGAGVWLLRMPKPPMRAVAEERQKSSECRRAPVAVLGASVIGVVGVLFGMINLAGPLVLVELGAAERTGGLVFLAAAVLTIFASRSVGILIDKYGATKAASIGILIFALAMPTFGIAPGVYATAALVVLLLLANNLCYISAGTMLTREGEYAGWSLYFVIALSATVWGLGETAGALMGGAGLDWVGSLWTSVAGGGLATALLVGVAVVHLAARRRSAAAQIDNAGRPTARN